MVYSSPCQSKCFNKGLLYMKHVSEVGIFLKEFEIQQVHLSRNGLALGSSIIPIRKSIMFENKIRHILT